MKRIVTVCLVVVFCLCTTSGIVLAKLSREEELQKIERIRQEIKERGYCWQAGRTSVSALTDEEFQKLLGLRLPPDIEERRARAKAAGKLITAPEGIAFPPSFDWRTQGGVTPVKNQGNCGSCWDFCATAQFESYILIYSGLEEDLSEQQVLSCNTQGQGCDGGWMDTAYEVWMNYGAVRESCMPYHENDTDPCIQTSCEVAATLDDYFYVDENIDAIKTALLDGPVVCAMAVCGTFSSYTGGCYDEDCTEINHGVLIVGWDDTMCNGQGAWIVKNSWGPDWGVDGYFYIKYGSCYIGSYPEALEYTPDQTVHFFYDSHTIDDSGGDGDGYIEVGEPIILPVTILNIGTETATNVSATLRCLTSGVTITDSVATYPDIPKAETRESNSPHFAFTVTSSGPSCGPIRFRLIVNSDQGSSPVNLTLQAGEIITVFNDDFETDKGWTAGLPGDDATTGEWERCDPNGTWWGNQPVQPEDDHTSGGTMCYVTGQSSPGASRGANDVDGGKTTLVSPVIDLSDKESAKLTYYRWYSSNTGSAPNDDDFVVDVSDDNGSTWHNLETLSYSDPGWKKMEFYLEDYISLTNQVKLRFIAQDYDPGSVVEAAIDDVVITTCQAGDQQAPQVTVVQPNGGEILEHGTDYEVRWIASDNVGVTSMTILLSTDGGTSFPDTIAADEPNDSSYIWTVPNIDSKAARIKIIARDAALNEAFDISDGDFTLWGTTSGIEVTGLPKDLTLEVTSTVSEGTARVIFGLPAPSDVKVGVYDVTGRLVKQLVNGHRQAGYYSADWTLTSAGGEDVSAGVYFVRLQAGEKRITSKIIVAR